MEMGESVSMHVDDSVFATQSGRECFCYPDSGDAIDLYEKDLDTGVIGS